MEINKINRLNKIYDINQSGQSTEVQHDNTYVGEKVTMDTKNPAELLGRSMLLHRNIPSPSAKELTISELALVKNYVKEALTKQYNSSTEKGKEYIDIDYLVQDIKKDSSPKHIGLYLNPDISLKSKMFYNYTTPVFGLDRKSILADIAANKKMSPEEKK